jgi:hypothetical protein
MARIDSKLSNPKDAVSIAKVSLSVIPLNVVSLLSVALMEGARKYGRHNYRRTKVRASVYIDATFRHMASWWEGEDLDPASGLSHIIKAMASLTVLADALLQDHAEGTQRRLVDDRPPAIPSGWLDAYNEAVKKLIEKWPDALPAATNKEGLQKPRKKKKKS